MAYKCLHLVWRPDRVEITTTDISTQTLPVSEKSVSGLYTQLKSIFLAAGWTVIDEIDTMASSPPYKRLIIKYDLSNGYVMDNPIFSISVSQWYAWNNSGDGNNCCIYVNAYRTWNSTTHTGIGQCTYNSGEWPRNNSSIALGYMVNYPPHKINSSDLYVTVGPGWWNMFGIRTDGAAVYPCFGTTLARPIQDTYTETTNGMIRYGIHCTQEQPMSCLMKPPFYGNGAYTEWYVGGLSYTSSYNLYLNSFYNISTGTSLTNTNGKYVMVPWFVHNNNGTTHQINPQIAPVVIPNIRTLPANITLLVGTMLPNMVSPEWLVTGAPSDTNGYRYAIPWNIPA